MDVSRQTSEELVVLAEQLLERQKADPIRNYPLHDKQRVFVNSVLYRQKPENWFIAANRSGKSDAGAFIGATLARFGRQDDGVKWDTSPNPSNGVAVRDRATSGWVSALDFPTSRDVLQPKYFNNGFGTTGPRDPFIPDHEIQHWSSEAQILRLKNGSIIGFKSAESGRKKYQGSERDWLHMDEEHPWEIYEEAVIRVGNKPLIFFCTCTILPPEGANAATISWVFPQIIQPWKEGRLTHVGLFGASIYDNPGIPRSEIRRLEAIYPEGSLSRRIRLDGEWLPGIGGARAYPAFDRTMHMSKEPLEIAKRQALLWCWDFNVQPMTSSVWQRLGGIYRCHRALWLEEGNIAEMCQLFYYHVPEHMAPIYLYGDSTGKGRVGQTGRSDYWTIMNEMKQYGCPIEMRVPEENPKIPDRVNAVNRLMRDEDGEVRVQLDPSCQEMALDFEAVLRDPKGGILKSRNRKDPYYNRTHLSDGAGYMMAYEEPVRVNTGRHRYVPPALTGPSYEH